MNDVPTSSDSSDVEDENDFYKIPKTTRNLGLGSVLYL